MSDSFADSGRTLSVTIKYGKDFDAPWLAFRGTPAEVREDLLATFGDLAESSKDLPLSQLVLNLSAEAIAMRVVVAKIPGSRAADLSGTDTQGGNPWAGVSDSGSGVLGQQADEAQAEPLDPKAALLAKIAACSTEAEIKELWVEESAALKADEDLITAFTEHGKKIKAAA